MNNGWTMLDTVFNAELTIYVCSLVIAWEYSWKYLKLVVSSDSNKLQPWGQLLHLDQSLSKVFINQAEIEYLKKELTDFFYLSQ